MKIVRLIFFLVLPFAACNRVHTTHLSPTVMAPVLAELHIADAYSGLLKDTLHHSGEKNTDSLAQWSARIFARHHISMSEFNQSMDWYRDHPQELDSLFASVIPILEKEKLKK